MIVFKPGQKVILLKGAYINGGRNGPQGSWKSAIAWVPQMNEFIGKQGILVVMRSSFWRILVDGKDTLYDWDETWLQHVGCPCGITTCIAKHNKER